MVNRRREAFLSLCGLSSEADLGYARDVESLAFCEAKLDPFAGLTFDGASRVDVVVRLRQGLATAFELKLGKTRLSKSRIDGEWLAQCKKSHRGCRWSGNMMAILDRRFPHEARGDLKAIVNGAEKLTLTRDWFVVARCRTVERWRTSRPKFSDHVRLLAFEDIVETYGGKEEFNALVREMLEVDFYEEWLNKDRRAG